MASNGSSIVPADLYRHFFETFQTTVNINDPLPVKVGSHCIRENEVDGEIVDWTLQYLQQKNCPSKLLAHLVSLILWEVRFCISKDDVDASMNKDKGYEPVKLMQLVTSKINNVCLEFLNNQKFESLCTELSFSNRPLHPVSVHAIRNGRRKMEDRHVVIQDMNTICSLKDDIPTSYYAVFDGHAGTDAAFYAASQLHEKLVHHSKFASEPSEALKEAFLATDLAFVSEHENERLKGGTTAVVSLIRGNLLLTAWLGDSQAVLVRDGVATQLVNPHKPDRIDEKERISNLGGEVIFWDGAYRVNGQLAVSRAIGDAGYKPYVTAEPDMVAVTLDGSEDFLVIGCDGLWDTIGVDEAAFIVLQYLHHETDISGLSGRLVQAAKQKGSSDNISVIVVFFREPELIARRPLPPAPTSVLTSNIPSMEQQQEEYEKLAAKWGWSEPQGGAVFDETPWQQQQQQQHQLDPLAGGDQQHRDSDAGHHQPHNPFDTSNPFGNGDGAADGAELSSDQHFYHSDDSQELAGQPGNANKWGWDGQPIGGESEFDANAWSEQDGRQTIPETYNGDSSSDFDHEYQHHHNTAKTPETPEIDAAVPDGVTAQWGWKDPEIEALEIEAGRDPGHFAATSVVPLTDHDVDLDQVRDQYEKVAAKWGRELGEFEVNGAVQADAAPSLESKSDFHLSSDGSTWDQTSGNAQSAGVDWNQYDEELSGQPSLIFVGQSDDSAPTGEQIISPIEDISVNELAVNGAAIMTEADRQMWASEENSVSFPPVDQDHQQEQPSQSLIDGSFTSGDEGAAPAAIEDETDFTYNTTTTTAAAAFGSSSVAEPAAVPDYQSVQEESSSVVSPSANDPDFHWNLHAPEFEFRQKEQQQQHGGETSEEQEPSVISLQLADQVQSVDSNSSNNGSGGVDDGTVGSSGERKLSATELLVRSSNDAQLAVLLAAANDDPDEMEPQELNISPRFDALDDSLNASNINNESKGDGTVDAEDSEDDWTFSDYRQPETNKEEASSEVADSSAGVEVESDSKVDEDCVQINCQANDLGNQLERLTVTDHLQTENIAPASEPVQIEPDVVQQVEEHVETQIKQVDETQSTVISSTVHEPELIALQLNAADNSTDVEVSSTQETVEPRPVDSPVSDSGATVGSETAATLVVTGTAIAVAGAVAASAASKTAKAKSPVAKSPVAKKPAATAAPTAAARKTTGTAAKPSVAPAKPAVKEQPAKKPEPAARRTATNDAKTSTEAATKPARPTNLSPLRKATPASSSTTPSRPAPAAAKTTPVAKSTAAPRPALGARAAPSAAKPAVSAASTGLAKKTTTTTTTSSTASATRTTATTVASRTGAPAPAKRVPSAPSTSATPAAKTPARPATAGARSTTSAASSTPPRRTVSASASTATTAKTSATSTTRPAAKPTVAATNGDVKPKPAPSSTTRTPAKPIVNGTASKTASAPKPSATTKPISSSSARPTPLKNVAGRTATPGKPLSSTTSKTAPKAGAGTPSRGTKATAASSTPPAATATIAPAPEATVDAQEDTTAAVVTADPPSVAVE